MRAKTLINEEIIQISHHLEHKETGPDLVCLKMGTFPQYLWLGIRLFKFQFYG